jgi:hypothetical protein
MMQHPSIAVQWQQTHIHPPNYLPLPEITFRDARTYPNKDKSHYLYSFITNRALLGGSSWQMTEYQFRSSKCVFRINQIWARPSKYGIKTNESWPPLCYTPTINMDEVSRGARLLISHQVLLRQVANSILCSTLQQRGPPNCTQDSWKLCGNCNCFLAIKYLLSSHIAPGSSGSIVSGYGLDDREIKVRYPAKVKGFFPVACVRTGSGAHPASCTMGTGGPFPRAKAAGVWRWPLTLI